MQRSELEHIIRAAAFITNQYEIVMIGSQSILGACPDAPKSLLKSMEGRCLSDSQIGAPF